MPERSVLIVQNITREGPGTIAEVLDANKIGYDIVDLSQNQKLPSLINYRAVVVMGGPDSANDQTEKMQAELSLVDRCLRLQIPFLGICLGMQDLVKAEGGQVVKSPIREVGFLDIHGKPFIVTIADAGKDNKLFEGLGKNFRVFHLHGETVIPNANIEILATGDPVHNQIVKVGNAIGIQAHFELTDEMLDVWLKEDPWLQELVADEVKTQFNDIKEEYTRTAWQLFTNFLTIANLIKKAA